MHPIVLFFGAKSNWKVSNVDLVSSYGFWFAMWIFFGFTYGKYKPCKGRTTYYATVGNIGCYLPVIS